jgi:Holliday junction resolvase-like predicted endonuclease
MDPENILKGRMAESLVEELLKRCGNKVYRFGYEAVLQNLTQLEESFDRESEMGRRITSIPDFIVVNKKIIFLVEVKFRTDLSFYEKDVKKLKIVEEFWQAKIIWVTPTKPYFRVSMPPYFDEKGRLNLIPVEKDTDLGITPNVLKEFNELIEKYYLKEVRL